MEGQFYLFFYLTGSTFRKSFNRFGEWGVRHLHEQRAFCSKPSRQVKSPYTLQFLSNIDPESRLTVAVERVYASCFVCLRKLASMMNVNFLWKCKKCVCTTRTISRICCDLAEFCGVLTCSPLNSTAHPNTRRKTWREEHVSLPLNVPKMCGNI
jgi:hypothetical protein